MSQGVVFIAYGDNARREALVCHLTLRDVEPTLPVRVISDRKVPTLHTLIVPNTGWGGRWHKTHLLQISPFDDTLYLDADTRVFASLRPGFQLLSDGWDMAMTTSERQRDDLLWHVSEAERERTFDAYGTRHLLALQPGVLYVRRNERTRALFDAWADEWEIEAKHDAAAFLRALKRHPVRLALLGRPFNGGAVIQHYFGRARA